MDPSGLFKIVQDSLGFFDGLLNGSLVDDGHRILLDSSMDPWKDSSGFFAESLVDPSSGFTVESDQTLQWVPQRIL